MEVRDTVLALYRITRQFRTRFPDSFHRLTCGRTALVSLRRHCNHKIASYETPLQSVITYMRNLNTHRSYETLRARRAELRSAGATVAGWELAKTLTKYSERGQESCQGRD